MVKLIIFSIPLIEKMDIFSSNSTLITFHEEKYLYTPHIAEFWNAISNIFYIIAGIGIYMKRGTNSIDREVMMVGIVSFCFHAWPSLFTEIFDEVGILHMLNAIIIKSGKGDQAFYIMFIYNIGLIIGNFYLFQVLLTVLSLYIMKIIIGKKKHKERVINIIFYMNIGVICWYGEHFDKLWFLHPFWHLFSSLALYQAGCIV